MNTKKLDRLYIVAVVAIALDLVWIGYTFALLSGK
jgi:hypothetical protein